MFVRVTVQGILDEVATLPHAASVLSPHAIEIRPRGFPDGVPNYRVLVERAAYQMRVGLLPDYLAVAVVAAIVAGVRSAPTRLDRLRDDLTARGWSPDITIGEGAFRLRAQSGSVAGEDEVDVAEDAVRAGLLLSEFALDQFAVIRPIGEMRPAVERSTSDGQSGEVWLYDPTERDRATIVHRSLENWLMGKVREAGLVPLDPAGEPFFDLAWRLGSRIWVCEVKSTGGGEVHQLRLGLGQVLQYRHQLQRAGHDDVMACLLIETSPADATWSTLCSDMGVTLFWPEVWEEVAFGMTGIGSQ